MLDRRQVLAASAATAATAAGLAAVSAPRARAAGSAPASAGRPHVVWFRSEDNSASTIGCYGNDLARTPTIDRLAREGVRFARHFSTSPVCAPSKLAILTGMHETSLGPGHHMRAIARVPDFVSGFATYLQQAGYWCSEQARPAANPDHNTDLTRTGYDDTTGDWRRRPDGTPFFALLGSMTTHESRTFSPTRGATDPAAVRLPAYLPDDQVLREGHAHYLDQVATMDGELAAVLERLRADGLLEDTIVLYSSDHGGTGPRSKRYCYDSGLHVPMVAWFPPRWQHLAPGPAGTVVEAPTSSIDAPATILALAGVDVPEHFAGTPFAGPRVKPRQHVFSGRNRMDEQLDFVRTVRDRRFRYVRNYFPHLTYAQHHFYMWQQPAVRRLEELHLTGRTDAVQARFFGTKPAEELYDLTADPDEVVDLAGDPRYRGRLAAMGAALDQHLLETHDNGFIPEGMAAEGWGPSREPGAFPIRRVLDLAGVAIRRRPRDRRVHERALGDDNEVVRWWGALGCSLLDGGAKPALPLLRRVARDDRSPWVRAQAADALTRGGAAAEGVALLTALVADTALPQPARLQAVWSLSRAGDDARPALEELRRASTEAGDVGHAASYAVEVVSGTYEPAA